MRAGRRGCRNPCGGGIQSVSAAEITLLSNGDSVYVGGENVTNGGYWTTGANGNVTAYTGEGTPTDNYIHYDAGNNTLTLHNATIKEALEYGDNPPNSLICGAAIGILNQNSAAALTITLEGTNIIENVSTGIYVLAHSSSTGAASLTITSENGGSLNASGSLSGISVVSISNAATLKIKTAKVTATSEIGNGVKVQAGESSNASLSVDGGSLTATSGSSYGLGIYFYGPSSTENIDLTVSNNAIVRANGGIASGTNEDQAVTTGGTGIVFNDKVGTVYGSVTLQDDLTVGKDESLTIPSGANLNANGKLTVDGGTITGTVTGGVTYKVTGVSLDKDSLTLEAGKSDTLTATVTPDNATNQAVTWTSSNTSVATVENGVVTAVSAGEAIITVTTADGGKTDACKVTVTAVPEPEPEPEPEPTPEPEPEPEEPEEAYIPSTPIPDGFHEYSLGTMLYVDGKRVKGLYESEGATYFFNEQGFMQTGWVEFAEGWRYFAEDGRMVTGWLQIGNAWYYLAPETGIMFDDGLHTIGKSTYYFYDWGGMASDWWYEDEAGDWYFFGGSGAMKAAQWLEWKGDWYYLTESGRMAVDTEIGGYYVNASGVWAG